MPRFAVCVSSSVGTNNAGEPADSLAGADGQRPLGELLFDDDQIESLDWTEQRLVLTEAASAALVSNLDDPRWGQEEFAPEGKYFDALDGFFVITFGDKVITHGVIAGWATFYSLPPSCPLLYLCPPMVRDGRLILGIGSPKVEEFGEEISKIFWEEGPEGLFHTVLPDEIKNHFAGLGKLSE